MAIVPAIWVEPIDPPPPPTRITVPTPESRGVRVWRALAMFCTWWADRLVERRARRASAAPVDIADAMLAAGWVPRKGADA